MAWDVEQQGSRWFIARNGRRIPGEVFRNRGEAVTRLREIRGPEAAPLVSASEETAVVASTIETRRQKAKAKA